MPWLPRGFHYQLHPHQPGKLAWRPGWRGTGAQPIRRVPIGAYSQQISSVPLTGGQAQTVIAGGTGTVSVGPAGVGTVWFPVQVTIQTTTGVSDTSQFALYIGSQNTPVAQVGTLFPGGVGTIALAIPSMTPGQYLIGIWTAAHNGDTASMNVIGTMTALSTG